MAINEHWQFVLVWFGVIFIRSGIYEDGIFRFNIFLPEDFPDGGHPVSNFFLDMCVYIYLPINIIWGIDPRVWLGLKRTFGPMFR